MIVLNIELTEVKRIFFKLIAASSLLIKKEFHIKLLFFDI
jgi:hypothetical protein